MGRMRDGDQDHAASAPADPAAWDEMAAILLVRLVVVGATVLHAVT